MKISIQITKTLEFHRIFTKSMKIIEFPPPTIQNHENHKISRENFENHENPSIARENHKN